MLPSTDETHESGDGPFDRDQQQPGGRVEIELKTELCMAHGICMELAPAYFTPDEDGYVSLTPGAGVRGDSAELQLAAASCPMKVITVRALQSLPSHSDTDTDISREQA